MIHTVTKLVLILIFIPLAQATNFTFYASDEATTNEILEVQIQAPTQTDQDIKIYIQDSQNNIISEIYNEKWDNPYYYIKSAFPDNDEFDIKPLQEGNHELCVQLRETGKTGFTKKCQDITINPAEEQPPEQSTEQQEPSSSQEEEQEESNLPTIQTPNNTIAQLNQQQQNNQDPIQLTPKTTPSLQNQKQLQSAISITTNKEKTRIAITYTFLFLNLIILILLFLKRL